MHTDAIVSNAPALRGKSTPRLLPEGTWDRGASERVETFRVVSLRTPAPNLDAPTFLAQAYGDARFYWGTPNGENGESFLMAGSGIAAEVTVPPIVDEAEVRQASGYRFRETERLALRLLSGAIARVSGQDDVTRGTGSTESAFRPRLFGGFAFRDDFIPDNTWSVFKSAQFFLPHYQFVEAGPRRFLVINAIVGPDEDVEDTFNALEEALAARLSLPTPSHSAFESSTADVSYPLSPEAWQTMVERATANIRAKEMEKVVLARVAEVRFETAINAASLLPYLDTTYQTCYRFLFEPTPYHAFVGATPELLISKRGRDIEAMALAGSAARGDNAGEDLALGDGLLASIKDLHEHQLVVDAIRSQVAVHTESLTVSTQPRLLLLPNIQHLLTTLKGRLSLNATPSVIDLVRTLHPTPAMGGVPKEGAMAFLQSEEPVPRGWYAAPIGWFDQQLDGVFAVAIRSAVVQRERAWLYAGAGIVGDSQAEHEWRETTLKFRPMLAALSVTEPLS